MYFLYVRMAGLLGRDDFQDREAWQEAAIRALEKGAVFVLMHHGAGRLQVADVAPLAGKRESAGIYLTEAARLAVDAASMGPVDFVENELMRPLYRLRSGRAGTTGSAPVAPPTEVAVAQEQAPAAPAPRGRGRPRKDAAGGDSPTCLATAKPPFDLEATYPSSREFFADVLDEQKEPGLAVLMAYLGFGKEERSVADMAADANITRAGMDLRLKSAARKHRERPEVVAFVSHVHRLMESMQRPILLKEVPDLDPWLRSEDILSPGFGGYLLEASGGAVCALPSGEEWFLSPVPKGLWKTAGDNLRTWLVRLEEDGAAVPISEFNAKVCEFLPAGLPDTFAGLLVESIDGGRLRRARLPDGGEVVAGFGRGVRPMVRAVLLESETALHADDILERVKARFNPSQTDMSIRNVVNEYALPFGKSTYGLRNHIGMDDSDLRDVIGAIERKASTASNRQWSVDEFAEFLRGDDNFAGLSLSPRRVNLILKAGPTVLHDLGKRVWSLEGEMPRQQIHDLAVAALERAGRPMTNDELRQEIEKIRGTAEIFQIQPKGNLIQVARATWGLIDRDLRVSEEDAKAWLQALGNAVSEAGHGLHVDEVEAVLRARGRCLADIGGVAPLAALAQRFGGLTMTRSRYFILPEWTDERRASPRQVVEEIIASHLDRTSGQLAELVSNRCGRPVSQSMVLDALDGLGYGYDSRTRRWVLIEDEA